MFQFHLFGFRITVQPSFWLVSLLMGGLLRVNDADSAMYLAIWVAVVFLSILWHELGHAFAFQRYKIPADIVLYSMGGLAIPYGRKLPTRFQDIVISAAGPLFQLAIGLPLWLMWKYHYFATPFFIERPFAAYVIYSLFWINLIWALVNLLPVFPLDGGHICRSLLGPRRMKLALQISFATAVCASAALLYNKQPFAGILFAMLAWNNWQQLNNKPEIPWMNAP